MLLTHTRADRVLKRVKNRGIIAMPGQQVLHKICLTIKYYNFFNYILLILLIFIVFATTFGKQVRSSYPTKDQLRSLKRSRKLYWDRSGIKYK